MKKILTQAELAKLLDVNQSTISKAISAGIITRRSEWKTQVRQYTHHLIEVAANRKGSGGLDIVQESARLKKLQGDKISLEIAQKNEELLSADILIDGVTATFGAVKSGLFSIPTKYRARRPHLSIEDIETLRLLIRDVCLEFTSDRFPNRIQKLLEKKLARANAAARSNGKPVGGSEEKAQLGK